MNSICTSLKQSKKLIELGIDVNTADMCWQNNEFPIRFNDDNAVPAWTLSALLGLMPRTIDKSSKWLLCKISYHKDILWFICIYPNIKSTPICDNPLNAAFEMVCWLKENKKI